MTDIELALHQGPACLGRHIRRQWPGVEVTVESIVRFDRGTAYETLRLEGEDVGPALRAAKERYADSGLMVLEQANERARIRFEIAACPLLPLFNEQELAPRFPFKVERDSDRWVIDDAPENLEKALEALWNNGLKPKMIRRDPSRRP